MPWWNNTTINERYPDGKTPTWNGSDASCLLEGEPEMANPITFEGLDAEAIKKAALHTHRAAGPSGLDAYAWRWLCSSFKAASTNLCEALASMGRRIATTSVNPDGLSAFVACRLIPLDKCPGVRPIGIGEVPRRIIAKDILQIIGYDVEEAAGSLQLCAGQDGGCEAAVHAMNKIFQTTETEAVLLVDATNVFNSLNRKAALHNISIICPSLAMALVNTYRAPVRLFITGRPIGYGNVCHCNNSSHRTTKSQLSQGLPSMVCRRCHRSSNLQKPQIIFEWTGCPWTLFWLPP